MGDFSATAACPTLWTVALINQPAKSRIAPEAATAAHHYAINADAAIANGHDCVIEA
jgi:hypothetical protein